MIMFGSLHFWLAIINYDWFLTIWLVILFFERKKNLKKKRLKVWDNLNQTSFCSMKIQYGSDRSSRSYILLPNFVLFCIFEVHLLLLLICDFIQGFHVLFCCMFVRIIKLIDILKTKLCNVSFLVNWRAFVFFNRKKLSMRKMRHLKRLNNHYLSFFDLLFCFWFLIFIYF